MKLYTDYNRSLSINNPNKVNIAKNKKILKIILTIRRTIGLAGVKDSILS